MINKINGHILTNDGYIMSNIPEFSIISSERYFPRCTYNNLNGVIQMKFLESTTVTVKWGDGTEDTFTTELREGEHVFDIARRATGAGGQAPSDIPYVSAGKDYGSVGNRLIKFSYNKELLVYIRLTQVLLPKQPLNFNFLSHPILKVFELNLLSTQVVPNLFTQGSVYSLDLFNVQFSNLEEIQLTSSIDINSPLDSQIPITFFSMPLKRLGVSGNHNTKTFNESNLNLIGEELADTLEELVLRIRFTNNQGISETPIDPLYPNTGGLPGNFLKLVNLKRLEFSVLQTNLQWSFIPPVIANMSWLEELNFDFSERSSGDFTIGNTFFSTMTNLKVLNINRLCRDIPDWTFINSLPLTFQDLQCLGNNNQTRLDTSIMACFNWVKNNSLSDKIFAFQSRNNSTTTENIANIPTGTYQEPIDHDNPASPLEAIWVLVNDYNCTVTYRTT